MAKPKIILIDDGKKDYWGRHIYRGLYNGKVYVEVEGVIHTTTSQGEPLSPLKYKKGEIIVQDNT
jgi:hypothetical protein